MNKLLPRHRNQIFPEPSYHRHFSDFHPLDQSFLQLTMEIIRVLAGEKSDPKDGRPKSAYDNLVLGKCDCDDLSEVHSLGFDIMRFNTEVIVGSNDGEV